MKLSKVLDIVNQMEKSSFLKLIDNFSNDLKSSNNEIREILEKNGCPLKNIENENIVKLFNFSQDKFENLFEKTLNYNSFQFDIICDIISRDGNSIMHYSWFQKLYQNEVEKLKNNIDLFLPKLEEENNELNFERKRDYTIYKMCVETAYENDSLINRENKITDEEKSILNTLASCLELSSEETRMIFYSITHLKRLEIDDIINSLKEIGVAFFNKKTLNIYFPDEIISIIRKKSGRELPNKYFKRILLVLTEPELNRICKKHGLAIESSKTDDKIKNIIKQGLSIKRTLSNDIFKNETSKTDKKSRLQEIINDLELPIEKIGATVDERIEKIIEHFSKIELDENIGISIDGYENLIKDLTEKHPFICESIKEAFELSQENICNIDLLMDYNIKPLDILDLVDQDNLKQFAIDKHIKWKGNVRNNILSSYRDMNNLFIENYPLIGRRDFNGLKEKGLTIKESELGSKYEEITKEIFKNLGYNVNETRRNDINSAKNKIDILLDLGENSVILIECKTIKEGDFSKYSIVSRQIKSYVDHCANNGLRVEWTILVSEGFTDEFIEYCEYDRDLNLSLIDSEGLLKIMTAFKESKLKNFPTKLFQKSGKLNAEMIIKKGLC
ncbi:MAG TPA: hypothetical protein PLD55_03745 [bacterium]|jgi:hypothetical protein|nr:restriction endonuclease [bacterium]MDX9806010.1 hypothetical protein [bacterium]HOG43108.1 hypothetical protein [bacterium]HPG35864.1 hypothetical protein [bacterium]HPM45881.1 hypothetical protein [bacterium]